MYRQIRIFESIGALNGGRSRYMREFLSRDVWYSLHWTCRWLGLGPPDPLQVECQQPQQDRFLVHLARHRIVPAIRGRHGAVEGGMRVLEPGGRAGRHPRGLSPRHLREYQRPEVRSIRLRRRVANLFKPLPHTAVVNAPTDPFQ